jgi:uncharacterized protein
MSIGWIILAAAAAVVLVALGYIIALVALQGRRMYRPRRVLEGSPADVGLAFEETFLTTCDGLKLHAWFMPAGQPDRSPGALLMCHGNGGNISGRLDSFRTYHELNLAVLAFDYRGYGQSEGRPSEEGTYRDAQAAWDYLVRGRGVRSENILILGRSLGGAVAAQLAAQCCPAGLVVESAFSSVPELAAQMYPLLPARRLCRFQYNTAQYVRQVRCPVLVLHSPHDDQVPFWHGRKIWEQACPPKWLVELEGPHNDAHRVAAAVYADALRNFVEHALAPANRLPGAPA